MGSFSARCWWGSERVGPAIGVVAIHVLIGYALVAGLKVTLAGGKADGAKLSVIDLQPFPPPPERPPPPRRRTLQAELTQEGGASSPPKALVNEHLTAPVARAPVAPIVVPVPPAELDGNAAGTGGKGSGGAGEGSGGTGSGQGSGAGTGGGFTGARQIRGRFRNSDFPASAKGAGRIKIGVRYAVGPSGVVDQCEIIETSGYPEVDAMTCRVIIDRYRFKPARDGEGVPVTEVMEEDYSWRRN